MTSVYKDFTTSKRRQAAQQGRKIGIPQMARLWNEYKASEGIVTVPRAAKGPSCKTFLSAEDCAAPCAWRTYGPKSSKSPVCYSPRTLSQQTRASIKAKAAARAALRPARQPKVKAVACKTYLSAEDCAAPCAWREAKGKKPAACYKPGTSRAPAAFRSSMGFGTFQQSGGYNNMMKNESYADMPAKAEGYAQAGGYYAQPAQTRAQMKGGYFAQPAQMKGGYAQTAETRAQMKGGYWF